MKNNREISAITLLVVKADLMSKAGGGVPFGCLNCAQKAVIRSLGGVAAIGCSYVWSGSVDEAG